MISEKVVTSNKIVYVEGIILWRGLCYEVYDVYEASELQPIVITMLLTKKGYMCAKCQNYNIYL